MREYFPKYSELPRDLFEQVKGILKGYDRLKRERLNVLHGSASGNGMPKGNTPGNPTEQRAIKLAAIDERLHAIGQADVLIRVWLGDKVYEDFDPQKAYWNYDYYNYMHKRTAEDTEGPSRRSWNRYKHRYSAVVAQNLKLF